MQCNSSHAGKVFWALIKSLAPVWGPYVGHSEGLCVRRPQCSSAWKGALFIPEGHFSLYNINFWKHHLARFVSRTKGTKIPAGIEGIIPSAEDGKDRRISLLITIQLYSEEHSSPLGRSYKWASRLMHVWKPILNLHLDPEEVRRSNDISRKLLNIYVT